MISYRIDLEDVHAHLYRVTLRVPSPSAEQLVSLPAWIPGSYLVREFARHLSALAARQGGREVPLGVITLVMAGSHTSAISSNPVAFGCTPSTRSEVSRAACMSTR